MLLHSIESYAIDTESLDSTVVDSVSFFQPAPSFKGQRFYSLVGLGILGYGTISYGLYNSWYKDFPKSKFQLFDDLHEWNQMDKVGHVFSGYFQSAYAYRVARWTGLSNEKSVATGIIVSSLFQTTLEIMDGFNQQWGFSIGDIGANVIGTGSFLTQQLIWKDQIVIIKGSASPRNYDNIKTISSIDGMSTTTLENRAAKLFGRSKLERALKDYNVQTYWASVDMHRLLPDGNKWPSWLNLAVGYGSENLWGGFNNTWNEGTTTYDLSNLRRSRQYYLSLDINLPKLKVKNHLMRGVLHGLNIFKTPSPTIEYSDGEFRFHLMFF
jgi:uncharacterized protein YfiM (DUF2279 family)